MDEYLLQGVHGVPETKPEERQKFLTTLRERVIVALTTEQVKKNEVFPQVEELMKDKYAAHLFLNGHLDYSYLSKYISIAKKNDLEFTIVTNKEYNSDIGLVIAAETAIDKENIYIKTKTPIQIQQQEEKEGFFSSFKNLFN